MRLDASIFAVLVAAVVSVVAITLLPLAWAAWLFYGGISAMVYLDRKVRYSASLTIVAFVVVQLHFLVALINAYLVALPGSEVDPITFHALAESISEGRQMELAVGWPIFVVMLGGLYRLFGPSLMLGQAIAIGAFMASCLVFLRLLDFLEFRREQPWLLALYGLTPSALLIGSFVLREPWELLFLVLLVYNGLVFLDRPAPGRFAVFVACGMAMAMFHWLLGVFVVAVSLSLLVIAYGNRMINLCTSQLKTLLVAAGSFAFLLMVFLSGDASDKFLGTLFGSMDNGLQRIYRYRVSIDLLGDPRTAYGVILDPAGFIPAVWGLLRIYFAYLLAPFTSSLDNLGQVYAVIESACRFIALLSMLATLMFARGRSFRQFMFLVVAYFLMTAFWAVGTTNAGQAIRHHVLSNWILIVAGVPFLIELFTRKRHLPHTVTRGTIPG